MWCLSLDALPATTALNFVFTPLHFGGAVYGTIAQEEVALRIVKQAESQESDKGESAESGREERVGEDQEGAKEEGSSGSDGGGTREERVEGILSMQTLGLFAYVLFINLTALRSVGKSASSSPSGSSSQAPEADADADAEEPKSTNEADAGISAGDAAVSS